MLLSCSSVFSSPGESMYWHCVIFVAVLKRYFIHTNLYLNSLIRINIIILRTLNPFPGKHLTFFYLFTNNCSYDNIIWNLLKGVLVWPSLRYFIHSKRCFSVLLKIQNVWNDTVGMSLLYYHLTQQHRKWTHPLTFQLANSFLEMWYNNYKKLMLMTSR